MGGDRELVLVFAGIAVVLALLYGAGAGSMTGFMTFEREVGVSVVGDSAAEISSFAFDRFIEIGEDITISAELANRGSVPLEGTFEVEVYDENHSLLYTYPGPTETVPPGGHMGRDIQHTPHETGTYTLRMIGDMGGTTLQTQRNLFVLEEPEPDMDPDPIIIERTVVRYVQPPPEPEPEPPERGWDVDVMDELELAQGSSTTIPVRIENTEEAVLRNVQMGLASSSNLSVEYDPSILFGIPPNQTRNFMLTLSVGDDVYEDQQLNWNVFENELSSSGDIQVQVTPDVTAEQLQHQLERLQRMLDDLEQELEAEEAAGFDVSDAWEHHQEAAAITEQIQQYIDDEEFDAAEAVIDDARQEIGQAYQTLFRQQSERLVVRAPLVRPLYLLLLGAVAVAVLLVAAYYYMREKRQRRPKLLREQDET